MEANQSLVAQGLRHPTYSLAITEQQIGLLKTADRNTQAAYLEAIRFSILGLLSAALVKEAQFLKRQPIHPVGSKERAQLVQARRDLVMDFYSLFRETGQRITESEVIDVLAS